MTVRMVADGVRGMEDGALVALMSEVPSEALRTMLARVPDEDLFTLVKALPEDARAKGLVAIAIGNVAIRAAAEAPAVPEEAVAPTSAKGSRAARQGRSSGRAKGASAAAARSKRAPGEKRSPQELAQLTERVHVHIKTNPGQGVEQIKDTLGLPTKELTLPLKKLLASKKIRTTGQKRATKYFPV